MDVDSKSNSSAAGSECISNLEQVGAKRDDRLLGLLFGSVERIYWTNRKHSLGGSRASVIFTSQGPIIRIPDSAVCVVMTTIVRSFRQAPSSSSLSSEYDRSLSQPWLHLLASHNLFAGFWTGLHTVSQKKLSLHDQSKESECVRTTQF